jgi:hypothetical protein
MPEDIIIGLKTIELTATMPKFIDTPERAFKKRVFTEDEWRFLNTRPTAELEARLKLGEVWIALIYLPNNLNVNQAEAHALSSNIRFQQDAIREIIESRKGE